MTATQAAAIATLTAENARLAEQVIQLTREVATYRAYEVIDAARMVRHAQVNA